MTANFCVCFKDAACSVRDEFSWECLYFLPHLQHSVKTLLLGAAFISSCPAVAFTHLLPEQLMSVQNHLLFPVQTCFPLFPGCCLPAVLTGSRSPGHVCCELCLSPSLRPACTRQWLCSEDGHCNGEKPNHYIIFPQPLLTPTKMSPLHLQLEQLNVFPALVNPQRHLRRTCLCSSCCLSQPLLLLFFSPYLLRDVIKKTFSLENPSTLPQRAPF